MKQIKWIKDNYILILALLMGAFLRFYNLEYQSVWLDEIHTLNESNPKQTIAELYTSLLLSDPHPPLYFILVYYLFKLIGYTTFTLHLFSAVTGVLGILTTYLLGKELFNKKVGAYSALILSINYFHLFYSQEGRMYALLFLFTTISFYYLIRFIKTPNLKQTFIYGLSAALMIYCHFFGLFTLVSQFLILLFFIFKPYKVKRSLFLLYCFIAGVFTIVLYIPTLSIFLKAAERTTIWIPMPSLDVYTQIFKDFFGQAELVIFFILVTVFLYFIHLFKSKSSEGNYINPNKDKLVFSFLVLFVWIAITLLIPLIRTYTALPMLISRYFTNVIPAILLIVSIALYYIRNEIVRYGIIALIVVFSITDIIVVKKYYKTVTKTQFREATNFIIENNKNNSPVVTSLSWYYPFFLNNDQVKMTIIDNTLQTYVENLMKDTIAPKAFWYTDAHNRRLNISSETQKYLEDNYLVEYNLELVDAWTNYYTPISSTINEIQLPMYKPGVNKTGDDFSYYVDAFKVDSEMVSISGWAYFHNQDATYTQIKVLLLYNNSFYKIGSQMERREDLNTYFKSDYNLSNSGFKGKLLLEKLLPGSYQVALLIENKSTHKQGLVLCDNHFIKN